ncbi:hypothetical protein GCM10011321_14390 [Youhaiella tibetensis]|uniref:Uncharacterized protein n=1 Tax=Paradevosia tibetensis TaxID=1447062 RepID=A0A5B9DN50_9HYPH|nr:hypothetical protein [Youhaiella tibetensis]QEE20436.1 hypothetical protein FNA67_09750 [Youhaiella tibetensis]GGF24162.1 hypothetical protein GCM10011321_14390 [Youhaiella tibetensis]
MIPARQYMMLCFDWTSPSGLEVLKELRAAQKLGSTVEIAGIKCLVDAIETGAFPNIYQVLLLPDGDHAGVCVDGPDPGLFAQARV